MKPALRPAIPEFDAAAVYVDPAHSRQGFGRALYAELLPRLRKGFHAAFAGIALPNPASIGLHESMGFTPVGIYREVGWKLRGLARRRLVAAVALTRAGGVRRRIDLPAT